MHALSIRPLFRHGLRLLLALGCLSGAQAEPGVSPREILIGQSITLQDGKNAYGVAASQGAQLYMDQLNAKGGIHGRKIRLRVLDDQNREATAESNARQLATDGVFILFGSIEGGPSNAVMKVANELKIPFFGPMAGSPTLRRPHQPYVFPVRAEHRDEFHALMNWGKRSGMTTVGLLHADSEVGRIHLENVRLIAEEQGLKLTLTLPFKGEVNEAGVDAMAKAIVEKKPDMIINHGSAGLYQRLIVKARAAGAGSNFMGVNSGSTQLAQGLGPLARGMVFAQVVPNPRERKHAISREYQDAIEKGGNKLEPSYGSLEGYLTAKALAMALQAAGPELTRSTLLKTLENARFDLGGISLRYAPGNHQGAQFVDLSMVGRDGRFLH